MSREDLTGSIHNVLAEHYLIATLNRAAVETFREVRDELLNEARLRRRRVTEPSMHSWESDPNKEGDPNGVQSDPSPKSPRLLSDADSTSTEWRLSGTWALHGKDLGEVIS